jgi:hypothetical protein
MRLAVAFSGDDCIVIDGTTLRDREQAERFIHAVQTLTYELWGGVPKPAAEQLWDGKKTPAEKTS